MKRLLLSLLLALSLTACGAAEETPPAPPAASIPAASAPAASAAEDQFSIPDYSGVPYVAVNDNIPFFTEDDLAAESYEFYSELDELGRCGYAQALIGTDLMPTAPRESISQVRPSGWVSARYDFVDGESLYNRSHLIAFQLAGENANEKNLITGTRTMNAVGMLPFEELVGNYVRETGHHVLYRVSPMFDGDELVARGVLMEAMSVEDNEIQFCVYIYNVEPGVEIDYATGENWPSEASVPQGEVTYVLNTGSKKFHRPDCQGLPDIKPKNRSDVSYAREDVVLAGYAPCGLCQP